MCKTLLITFISKFITQKSSKFLVSIFYIKKSCSPLKWCVQIESEDIFLCDRITYKLNGKMRIDAINTMRSRQSRLLTLFNFSKAFARVAGLCRALCGEGRAEWRGTAPESRGHSRTPAVTSDSATIWSHQVGGGDLRVYFYTLGITNLIFTLAYQPV